MLNPDARRQEQWHRRNRGQGAVWSALAGVAIAVLLVVGGLFWASVWGALRTSIGTGADAAPELVDAALAPGVDGDDRIEAAAVPEGTGTPEVQAAVDDLEAFVDVPPRQAAGTIAPDVGEAAMADPAEGSADIAAATEEPGAATATADGAEEPVAESGEPDADQAEALTARLEGLAERLEALAARLEAAPAPDSAPPTAQPGSVPVPVAAPTRPERAARATQAGGARAPWVLLPRPGPGSRVAAGPLILETRARGEDPITQIRMALDGVALPVALEQRDDTTWRGQATTRVGPGTHAVVVAVVDAQGRTGSYRWHFDVGEP